MILPLQISKYDSFTGKHKLYLSTVEMGLIVSFIILLSFVPSLSLHVKPVVRRYYSPFFARSTVPRPELRSVIATPRLQRLYVAKEKIQLIEKEIDSEIEQILQKQIYRRNFDNSKPDLDSMPFFNPKPTDSFSAAIGAQGGAWYPGPAGAGIEGSRMLEGRASQEGLRRSQYLQTPSAQGEVRHTHTSTSAAQSLEARGIPRELSPTVQSTPDPSEEIDSEWNIQQINSGQVHGCFLSSLYRLASLQNVSKNLLYVLSLLERFSLAE